MQRVRGFTLVEIAVVLVIVSLIAAVLFAGLRTATTSSKYRTTNQVLQNAAAALVNYVTVTKRLPCPANGSVPAGTPGAGVAAATCASPGDQTNGVVPWVTLGIPFTDVVDGFGNLITYRVFAALTVADSMNFTSCDTSGTNAAAAATASGCACPDNPAFGAAIPANCTPPLQAFANKGLLVQGAAPSIPTAIPSTGAAYVLISHGPNLGPAWTGQGTVMSLGTGTIGTNEANFNGANQDVFATPNGYFDSAVDQTETPSHFDDILLHPSVQSVVTRAGLGPRTHP